MGYNVKAGVVDRYAQTLEQIKIAIESGRPATFSVDHPAHLAKLRDQLHWFLRCAKIFTDEAGGRYADLRDRVKVSVDWQGRCVTVAGISTVGPSKFGALLATPSDPTERDVLRTLEADNERPVIVQSFHASPSYQGDEWMETEGERLGYEVMITGEDGGLLACVAKRRPKAGAFDLLKRSGYTTS